MEIDQRNIYVFKTGTEVNKDEKNIEKLAIFIADKVRVAEKNRTQFLPVIVGSGAIFFGMEELNISQRPVDMETLKLCASAGQPILVKKYQDMFKRHGLKVGQILLTYEDLADKNTAEKLIKVFHAGFNKGVVFFINYNDPLNGKEILEDNDMLAAVIGAILKAEKLIIFLKGIHGLLDFDKKLIPRVEVKEASDIDDYKKYCFPKTNLNSTGGMLAKINAAAYFVGKGGIFSYCILTDIENKIEDNFTGECPHTTFRMVRNIKMGCHPY